MVPLHGGLAQRRQARTSCPWGLGQTEVSAVPFDVDSGGPCMGVEQHAGSEMAGEDSPMDHAWGAAGAVEETGDSVTAVASQVAARSGRAGLPRPPSLPRTRITFRLLGAY